jgi:hypothetical protein
VAGDRLKPEFRSRLVARLGPDFAKASSFAKASADTPSRPDTAEGAP